MFGQTNALFQPENNDKHGLSILKVNIIALTAFSNNMLGRDR